MRLIEPPRAAGLALSASLWLWLALGLWLRLQIWLQFTTALRMRGWARLRPTTRPHRPPPNSAPVAPYLSVTSDTSGTASGNGRLRVGPKSADPSELPSCQPSALDGTSRTHGCG